MAFIQTDTYLLRHYECDANGWLSVPALMNLLQESANRNAADYGMDSLTLQQNGLGWMLMRFGLTMHHYPRSGQSIRIVTYPTGAEKFFVYRDFRIYAADDTLLAEATSTWLVFDAAKRSMVPAPGFIRTIAIPDRYPPLPRLPSKPDYQLTASPAPDFRQVSVGWFDIDGNQHVNNVVYIRWLLEQLPDLLLQTKVLTNLDVAYRTETHWHDSLNLYCQVGPRSVGPRSVGPRSDDPFEVFIHRLGHADTGKEVLLAKTVWAG